MNFVAGMDPTHSLRRDKKLLPEGFAVNIFITFGDARAHVAPPQERQLRRGAEPPGARRSPQKWTSICLYVDTAPARRRARAVSHAMPASPLFMRLGARS